MAVVQEVDNPPTSDEDRADFAAVNELALSESANGKKTKVTSIGGAVLPVVLRTTLAPVKVEFDVILDIVCEGGDCTSALAGAAAAAEVVTSEISNSMTDGSFAKNLKESATSLGVESLKNVVVDADTFSSSEPEITESGGGDSPSEVPSAKPSLTPVPSSSSKPSGGDSPTVSPTTPESESESIFEMILQFLADILDFLIPF